MENIYNKFIGKDNYFQKNQPKIYPMQLSRSGSNPLLSPFYANKLPSNLTGEISNYKNRNKGITSSDIKVQILEERLRNLEANKSNQLLLNEPPQYQLPLINNLQNQNNKYPSLPNTFIPNKTLPLINNNDIINRRNNEMMKNEILCSKKKLFKHRGLTKEDYMADIYNSDYNKIKKTHKYKQNEPVINKTHHHKNNYKEDIINENNQNDEDKNEEIKMRNKAKKFHKKLKHEVYTPFQHDYNEYIKNVNLNIQRQLKNDNDLIKYNIFEIENNYNEIKDLLEKKIERIELKQKLEFENLKKTIQKCGGQKISCAIENVFEGANYDLQKAGDEDLLNNAFNFPEMIKEKMEIEERKNKEMERQLKEEINMRMNMEFQREREIEEIRHKEKIKMMELKQEKQRIENMRMLNELRYKKIKEENKLRNNMINNNFNCMNNNSDDKFEFGFDEMFKLLLIKKMEKSNKNLPFNFNNISNMNMNDIMNYMLYNKMMSQGTNNKLMNNLNNITDDNNLNDNIILNKNINNLEDNTKSSSYITFPEDNVYTNNNIKSQKKTKSKYSKICKKQSSKKSNSNNSEEKSKKSKKESIKRNEKNKEEKKRSKNKSIKKNNSKKSKKEEKKKENNSRKESTKEKDKKDNENEDNKKIENNESVEKKK